MLDVVCWMLSYHPLSCSLIALHRPVVSLSLLGGSRVQRFPSHRCNAFNFLTAYSVVP
jgi:hypothetical protein